MAYASLAGVPPVYGMYSSFFTSSLYMLFGTSRHISIGVFAVASMMVGASKLRHVNLETDPFVFNGTTSGDLDTLSFISILSFTVGTVQMLLGVMRLGFVTSYLSDPLVSGFTTGSAVHVCTSQLNKVFGVKLPRHEGIGMIVRMLRDLVYSIPDTNWITFSLAIFGIIFLDLGRTYLNPLVKKISRIPPPLELLLVIFGVVVSTVLGLKDNYDVKVVDNIPTRFPSPSVPRFDAIPALLPDAISIAIVSYMFVMSMGKLFAKKHRYRIDPTQEFYATGLMHMGASFFPVYPVGASLSRSSVCEMSGANTLFYTLFSSSLLLVTILLLGPFLEPLPMCILASIVIVSLKGLLLQVKVLKRYYKISKHDFAVWLVACLATVLTDVTTGLTLSLFITILTVVLREQWPAFVAENHEETARQVLPGNVALIKFHAPLHFANVAVFTDKMAHLIEKSSDKDGLIEKGIVLVDCSAISYIDTMGVDAVIDAHKEAVKADLQLFFVGFNESVRRVLERDEQAASKLPKSAFYSSVDRAIIELSKS